VIKKNWFKEKDRKVGFITGQGVQEGIKGKKERKRKRGKVRFKKFCLSQFK